MCTTNRLALATLLLVTTAHRVSAAPNDCAPLPPPVLEAPPCCPCACALGALKAEEHTALALLMVGLTLFVPAYVAGTAYAFSLPGSVRAVDSLPIVGAFASGARNFERENNSRLFSSGNVQVIGALLAVVAAAELADIHERRWQLDVDVGPASAGLSAQLRW